MPHRGRIVAGERGGDSAEEDIGRREEGEAVVAMLIGVPAEEFAEPTTSVTSAAEASGVVRLVLDGLEAATIKCEGELDDRGLVNATVTLSFSRRARCVEVAPLE